MTFADILRKIDSGTTKKLTDKVPEWNGADIRVPKALNIEQCSSSATARYKAEVALKAAGNVSADAPGLADIGSSSSGLADLTGGLGVDCWHFSKVFGRVLYNERDPELAEAVRSNFKRLGADVNVDFSCLDADSPEMQQALARFRPDVVFLDPARRSDTGRKVFLLEDCSPNVLDLIPKLLDVQRERKGSIPDGIHFRQNPVIVLKLSPMADITMLRERLGTFLSEIHIVEYDGECKELLCVIDKRNEAPFRIVIAKLRGIKDSYSVQTFSFLPAEESNAQMRFVEPSIIGNFQADGSGSVSELGLFEPGPALMKSGAFRLLCEKFGMEKISQDTNLYIDSVTSGMSEAGIRISDFGKEFKIIETSPLSGSTIKAIGKKYPHAEVSARGIMMKSDELRKRLGVRSGGDIHIFGVSATDKTNLLLVCHK